MIGMLRARCNVDAFKWKYISFRTLVDRVVQAMYNKRILYVPRCVRLLCASIAGNCDATESTEPSIAMGKNKKNAARKTP